MDGKIKIRELNSVPSLDSPNFVLTLEQGRSKESSISNYYDAITRLVGNDDVVLGLDTTLMNLPGSRRESYFLQCLEAVRKLGLEYRCFESNSDSDQSLLSFLFKKKSAKKQEMLAYIPNEIWKQDEFKQSLPLYGARYYITKDNSDGIQALEKIFKMIDAEKMDYFKMIAFGSAFINSIGICSKYQTLPGLKELFGIQ